MKHGHYSKNVSHLSAIDVYRVLSLFGVTDQAIGHAIKKLLCPGQRGAKTKRQDIQEAIDTLERWKAMEDEDSPIKDGYVEPLPVKYSSDQVELRVNHVALTDIPPNPACKIVEPAAAIDDESPRMQAIGQNGNGGEHYSLEERLKRWKESPKWAKWLAMDKDLKWCWFEEKPFIQGDIWMENSTSGMVSIVELPSVESWSESLERRP